MTQLETRTEPMVVNFGPHHPSMHGVLRLVVTLDGEDVVDCEPVVGYLHRGMEKIAENRTNVMFVPYVSRMDYAAGMFYEAIVVNAPERLADVPVPTVGINDVLIRIDRTGICGTDLHIFNWDAWAQKTIPVPMVVGHEFVGEVVEVGANVHDFFAGDIVSGAY
jgi:NADH:ubiquinone oxidoreductase subunit D